MKRLVFDLKKIPFLKRLISISRLIVVLNDQNLFTESHLGNWFPSYVQFRSGGHFSERSEAARYSGKMNHLSTYSPETFKVSSQSRKFEFNVFSMVHLNDHNF